MRGDSYAVECLGPDQPLVKDATEEDWGTEYLDYIMSVSYTHLDVYKRQQSLRGCCLRVFHSIWFLYRNRIDGGNP